jgi:hypothetical protein
MDVVNVGDAWERFLRFSIDTLVVKQKRLLRYFTRFDIATIFAR